MTAFDIYDRYDFIISCVTAILAVGSLILGAPLWVFALIAISCCVIGSIRHSTNSCTANRGMMQKHPIRT